MINKKDREGRGTKIKLSSRDFQLSLENPFLARKEIESEAKSRARMDMHLYSLT